MTNFDADRTDAERAEEAGRIVDREVDAGREWPSQLTPGDAIQKACKAGEAMGYGPVRRMWFSLGAELYVTEPGRKRYLRPTERQHRWLDEGQKWAAAQTAVL